MVERETPPGYQLAPRCGTCAHMILARGLASCTLHLVPVRTLDLCDNWEEDDDE